MKSGFSEVHFGNMLRRGGFDRSRMIIANKFWHEFYPEQSMEQEIDASLQRLQLDHVDLMYSTPPPETMPMEELVTNMGRLQDSGRFRAWGVVNWSAEKIQEACDLARQLGISTPCAAQLPYNILMPLTVEGEEIRKVLTGEKISVVASWCLMGGLLTGKYHNHSLPYGARLDRKGLDRFVENGQFEKAEKFVERARRFGMKPSRLALAFCLYNQKVCSLLFGATSATQIKDNVAALNTLELIDEGTLFELRTAIRKKLERKEIET